MAVAASFVLVGSAAWLLVESSGLFSRWPQVVSPTLRIHGEQVLGLMAGVIVGAILGFLDDRFQVRARWQLVGQVVLAFLAIGAGIVITWNVNPLLGIGVPIDPSDEPLKQFVTVLWIVGMVNSINFVDGLDGLSTGVSLIAALTLGVISLTGTPFNVEPIVGLMCAVLAGSLAGFLPWNFHPAKVFIGTTGVFAVGFALAALSILGTAKIAVALLVLGVPIIDTFWIIIRRVSAGRSPFTPDRGHFHHRLLDLGLTHRDAVLLIYGICAILAVISIVLAESAWTLSLFAAVVVGGGLVLYLFSRRAQEALDPRSYPDDESDGSAGDAGGPAPDLPRPHGPPERDEARAHRTGATH
jgi:UDP-GlcNAc:undecaprenyl-phosphate GlcNAc-1-phosphate transferase